MAYKTKGAFACLLSAFVTVGILNGFIKGVNAGYDYNQGYPQGMYQQSAYPYQESYAQSAYPYQASHAQSAYPYQTSFSDQQYYNPTIAQQSAFPMASQEESISFAEASAAAQQQQFGQQQQQFGQQQQQFGQSAAIANSGNNIMMYDLQSGHMIAGADMSATMTTNKRTVKRKELTRTPDAYDVLFSTSLLLLLTKFFDFIL